MTQRSAAAPGLGVPNAPAQDIEALIRAFSHRQYAAAEQLALAMTRTYPQNGFGWKVLGAVLEQTGRAAAALEPMRKSAQLNPADAEARSNLGVTLHKLGRLAEAEESYRRAIAVKPDYSGAHYNRGVTLKELGRLAEAEESYRRAIAIKPDYAEAHSNLGVTLHELGRLTGAEESYQRAIAIKPDYSEAHSNLGVTLHELGRLAEAEESYQRAIAIKPDYSEAHYNRGVTLYRLGRLAEAEESYQRAVAIKPDYAEAHSNLGVALKVLGRLAEAEESYRRAIAIKPDYAEAHSNLGVALKVLGRLAEAERSYRRAIAIKPDYAEAHSNLGVMFKELGRLAEAEESCRRAIVLQPDHAGAHWNLSLLQLLLGDFSGGWLRYEWRWQENELGTYKEKRDFPEPLWLGEEPLAGRTILLHAEQGLGDTLQFCRYAPLVNRLGATVILEAQPPLVSLLAGLEGVTRVIARGEALPAFDYHCPLMSLPLAFRTSIETIPADIPYIKAEPAKAAYWQTHLGVRQKPRVGLVWNGGFRPHQPEVWAVNGRRNIPLELISRINVSGFDFYSLQKGEPAESELLLRRQEVWPETNLFNFAHELKDFSDTAALIENLDLVISVDTSTAHLAAAMGKPVWLLNRFDTCWRWLLNRDDSPWYPTVRLFRQERPGDWESVISRVARTLQEALQQM
jgi:tetratricopeptide (TPR) repeat protein